MVFGRTQPKALVLVNLNLIAECLEIWPFKTKNAYSQIAGLIKTNIWNLVYVDFSNQRFQFKTVTLGLFLSKSLIPTLPV